MGSPVFLIWIVLIGAMFYFMMIRPQKRARSQQSDMQQHLQPGAYVRTTAQIMGTIVEVGDDWAIVETTPGTRIKFGKPAIVGVILEDEDTADDSAEDAESAEDAPTPGGIGDAPAAEKRSVQDAVPAQAQDSVPAESDESDESADQSAEETADAATDLKPAGEVKDAEPAKS
ncbi:preprotein translocase subunit YajC [Catenulispora pinisilvae]|uniref:preprotein translocase subunit YajC n=1 Tax=Catenulispora pinisilvae TaxID=2705253 RepID=UPI0018923CFE|nr:preprotein translocase subunit YajC [Catenulispora pinisilvae]